MTANFYRMESSGPRPTPNLEDQGISLSLAPPSKPVRHGWPYQQLCCRRHSFRVHWFTHKPPHPATKCFRQGGDTIEGDLKQQTSQNKVRSRNAVMVLCSVLRSEDAFVITCVANVMEVKVLYVQQHLRYEISSYWRFNI
jgi:hypothetical protein